MGTELKMVEGTDPEAELAKEYQLLLARRRLFRDLHARPTLTVDEIISEMKAYSHGPDLSPQFYEEMRKSHAEQQLNNEGGEFQPFIHHVSEEIRERLKEKGMTLPVPVFAGQFPHGSFNAQARRVPGGVLILINSGLFMFIYQMLKIATMATRFTDFNEKGELIEHPEIPATGKPPEEITRLLTDCVLAYILHGDSTLARRLPTLGGVRQALLARLVHACESFTVAHEFGHVIDGHFSKAVPVLDADMNTYISKDHLQEYNADQIAAALLIAGVYAQVEDLSTQPQIEEHDLDLFRLHAAATIAGPFLFFALSHLIDQVRRRVRSVPASEPAEVSSHPPPQERSFQLRAYITNKNNAFDFELADSYTEFFAAQIDPIVAEAQRRFGETQVYSQR